MPTSWPPYRPRLKTENQAVNEGITHSLGYPVLFHWAVLAIVGGLLLFAALKHILSLLAITIFISVLAVLSRLLSWRALKKLFCQMSLSENRAFPGEKIDLSLVITNSKRLFLSWLDTEVELPYKLVTGKATGISPYTKERLRWATSISGGQQLSWKHTIECQRRGEYWLGPLRLCSGDTFGLFPRELVLPIFKPLLVYPRIVPIEKLGLPLRQLVGERVIPRSIYEDASLTMGSRDYHRDDPFKRIHWKASARLSQLQVRQYESTTSLSLLLILDVSSFGTESQADEELFELAVTTVASLGFEAYRQDLPFGLIANSVPEIEIPIGNGRSQLMLVLESLAPLQVGSRRSLHQELDKYRAILPLGASMVVVSGVLSPSTISLVHKLRHAGHSLLLVNIGDGTSPPHLHGVPVFSVSFQADISRLGAGRL